jgi:hypothetical protein
MFAYTRCSFPFVPYIPHSTPKVSRLEGDLAIPTPRHTNFLAHFCDLKTGLSERNYQNVKHPSPGPGEVKKRSSIEGPGKAGNELTWSPEDQGWTSRPVRAREFFVWGRTGSHSSLAAWHREPVTRESAGERDAEPDHERSVGLARARESFCVRQDGDTWLYSRE